MMTPPNKIIKQLIHEAKRKREEESLSTIFNSSCKKKGNVLFDPFKNSTKVDNMGINLERIPLVPLLDCFNRHTNPLDTFNE